MIAGKGHRRVMALVARFADIWTSSRLSVDDLGERNQQLDVQLARNERPPESVKRACMDMVVCWRDEGELERRLGVFRRLLPAQFATLTTIELRDKVRSVLGNMIDGTPGEIVDQIRAYVVAGLDELMIDWFDCDDLEGLQVLAAEVLPQVAATAPGPLPEPLPLPPGQESAWSVLARLRADER
jgi:alkanesulfonate monooxygenase SsuD/methylene tetrahydromethanopterin reductase-like flavin-dependent oxidoreductase (luciferase family)